MEQKPWEDLNPGDVVEYKGNRYMYYAMDGETNIGGWYGIPEPVFTLDHPTHPMQLFYLRTDSSVPGGLPDCMKESAGQATFLNTGAQVGFLNASRNDLKKVGRVTPEEWNAKCDELRKELSGKT